MQMLSDIRHALPTAVVMLVFWTAAGLPVMKLSARDVPLHRLTPIALQSFASVLLVLALLGMLWTLLLRRPFASPSPIAVAIAFIAGGWLMNRWLKQIGIERPFPGIGARAMLAAFLATLAAFAYVLWLFAAPTHQL